MRLNQFIARATGLSRRAADYAVSEGRVTINGKSAQTGRAVTGSDTVQLDGTTLVLPTETLTIILNKPVGYVCSRAGQGSRTIYELLPPELHRLKPVGRLDKDSSGLLLLTDDGDLANELTHPRHAKEKIYEVALDRPLTPEDAARVEQGVKLEDGPSKLQVKNSSGKRFTVTMHEGRNRQIRRTFAALGYDVRKLHRIQFGHFTVNCVQAGTFTFVE